MKFSVVSKVLLRLPGDSLRECGTDRKRGFAFGENWRRFLRKLDDDRIERAKRSLQTMLAVDTLAGKTFVDAGSGSGLFSLAARQLGLKQANVDG